MLRNILLSLVVLLLLPCAGFAIGISPSYLNLDFQPGLQYQGTFEVINNGNETLDVNVYSSGDLSQYVNLSYTSASVAPFERKPFYYNINMPADVLPGSHIIRIGAVEVHPEMGGIGAVASVEMIIFMDVPYPPKYLDAWLNVSAENDDYIITASAIGRGNESVDFSGTVTIYDYWNHTAKTMNVDTASVQPGTVENINKTVPADQLKPGAYRATVRFDYEGGTAAAETEFAAGKPEIKIGEIRAGWMRQGETRNVSVNVTSSYGGDIEDIFAAVQLENRTIRSNSTDLAALENRTVDIPVDTSSFRWGIYKANVTVLFAGGQVQEQTTLYVLPKNIIILVLAAAAAIAVIIAAIAIYLLKRKNSA